MKIRKEEVLRYMGYHKQQIDHSLDQLIHECIEEIIEISKPRFIYKVYNIYRLQNKGLFIDQSLKLKGESIKNHLENCTKATILAATLGIEVERTIKKYQLIDMTRAVILDACASEAIEGVCNEVQEKIHHIAREKDYYITSRFSPGYGDLPMEMQSEIANYLETPSRIGLSTSQENLLIPRKSVTAFIGLSKKNISNKKSDCRKCNLYGNCNYGKKGTNCGNFREDT